MDDIICPDCGSRDHEPADAGLGHRVLCHDCALAAEMSLLPARTQQLIAA